MNYLSTKEIAEKWGISQRRIVLLAQSGRIPGARLFGNNWLLPSDAQKPADGRTRAAKALGSTEVLFRFPIYADHEESDYSPPLTAEERQLRAAQLAFYACRFDEARKLLLPLAEGGQSRYIRISALFYRCMVAAYDINLEDFERYYGEFNVLLAEDFPYRQEMLLFRYLFCLYSGYNYKDLLEDFRTEPDYVYHPSTYDIMAVLSAVSLSNGDFSLFSKLRFDGYEVFCMQMEQNGHFVGAMDLHCLLITLSM